MNTRNVVAGLVAAAICLPPVTASAQRGQADASIEGRLNQLQRTVGDLSARVTQLRQREQQLQQQFEKMRTDYEQRLERLEKAGPGKAPIPRSGPPKPK